MTLDQRRYTEPTPIKKASNGLLRLRCIKLLSLCLFDHLRWCSVFEHLCLVIFVWTYAREQGCAKVL